ncbi:hypothetical protein ACGFSD_11960 [Streptomyces caniferus]
MPHHLDLTSDAHDLLGEVDVLRRQAERLPLSEAEALVDLDEDAIALR